MEILSLYVQAAYGSMQKAYYIVNHMMPDNWAFRRDSDGDAVNDAPDLAMKNVETEGLSHIDVGEKYDYEWALFKVPEDDMHHGMEKDWWAGVGVYSGGIHMTSGVICAKRTESGIEAKHCS